jgi:hypothetical protein
MSWFIHLDETVQACGRRHSSRVLRRSGSPLTARIGDRMNATRPLDRLALFAALLGGAAWIADTTIIAARNDSFGLADSALFLFGMAAILLAGGLVAVMAARRFTGARRVLVAIAVFAGIALGLAVLSLAADGLSHSLYSGGNRGLHKECGVFAMGAAAIAGAGWLGRQRTVYGPVETA